MHLGAVNPRKHHLTGHLKRSKDHQYEAGCFTLETLGP